MKKFIIGALMTSILGLGFTNKSNEFKYKYEIVLNSNSNSDLIKGYRYKEYLTEEYNRLIKYLDTSLHTKAIINNIDNFAYEGSRSEYKSGIIVVYVGEAKGDAITGTLKSDSCDNSKMRVKFFFSNYFFK